MTTEDKGQASGLEVELAVPVTGTEQTPPPAQQPPPVETQEDPDGEAVAGTETDEERSARAERRRRSRERNRLRDEQRDEIIARQGEMLEQLFGVVQGLSGHAQGNQLQQAQQAHASAKVEMAKAYESGDPQKVAEATENLTIARLNLDAISHRRPSRPQATRPQAGQEGQERQANPYQSAWLERNGWYRDPERREDAAIAFGISQVLVDEGYPENDPEHFAELDRRLKKRGVTTAQSGHQAPKTIVASGQRQSLTPGKTKVTLTPRMQEHAARFGMDLKDPATRERIAKRFLSQQTR